MSNQQKKREQLKQQLLDQIKTQQEGIEALSDEELESVAGGVMTNLNIGGTVTLDPGLGFAPVNTGMVMPGPVPGHNMDHIEQTRNVNTGTVMPRMKP